MGIVHHLSPHTDVLGHPFGKVPSPKPFDANSDEAQVILTDPTSPIGREVLAGESCLTACIYRSVACSSLSWTHPFTLTSYFNPFYP